MKIGLLTPSVTCVVGALALAGCGSSSSSSTSSTGTTPTTATATAPARTTGTAKLTLQADPSGMLAFQQTKLTASAGSVTIVFENASSVAHNVVIADSAGKVVASTPTFASGSKTLSMKVAKGVYTYYCTVPGHRQAGMQGTLTVS